MVNTDAPRGTTHLLHPTGGSFDTTPTYMKWSFDFRGPESGTVYSCWWNWHQGEWHRDRSFANRFPDRLEKL